MEIDTSFLNRKVQIAARRVLTRERLRLCFRSLLAGALFCLVLLALSRFIHIPYIFAVALTGLAISAAAGLVLALRRKVSPFEGAVELDSLFALKERLATAIELEEKGGISEPLALSQLADSVRISESVNPTALRIRLPKELPLTILFLILCASVMLFQPLYTSSAAAAKELQIKESIRLQIARKSLQNEGSALKKQFDEAARKIEEGEMKEALISVAALKKDLSHEYSKASERERALAELEAHPELAKIAQALRQNSDEALLSESERLSSEGAGAANVTQILKDIAREISQDSAFRTLLENLAKAMDTRDQKELEESLKGLAAFLSQADSAHALSEALADLEETEKKIAQASGGVVTGRAPRRSVSPIPSPALPSSPEQVTAPPPSEEIEQAIAKQNVPERFKQVVRGYFTR
jgi:hypothetical protein